jgi:4-hydroxy-3-polyprenylbenzoate decarboxylase
MGVVIMPPVPAFYHRPESLDEVVTHVAMRALDQLGLHLDAAGRWDGVMTAGAGAARGEGAAEDKS